MMTDYKEDLTAQLSEELEVSREKFVDSALLKDDLGFDSLDLVDVVVLIEQTVGVKLSQRDFAGVKTFGQLLELIERKRQA